jgi:hypothetical protein
MGQGVALGSRWFRARRLSDSGRVTVNPFDSPRVAGRLRAVVRARKCSMRRFSSSQRLLLETERYANGSCRRPGSASGGPKNRCTPTSAPRTAAAVIPICVSSISSEVDADPVRRMPRSRENRYLSRSFEDAESTGPIITCDRALHTSIFPCQGQFQGQSGPPAAGK